MAEILTIETSIYYQSLSNPELKALVLYAWNTYEEIATEEAFMIKRHECEQICLTLEQILRKKKLWQSEVRPSYVDIMMAAVLLHSLLLNDDDWTSIFLPRLLWSDIGKDLGVPQTYLDALFQTIEAQMGEDTPVPNVKPVANTPTDFFALAIWIVKDLYQGDKLWN